MTIRTLPPAQIGQIIPLLTQVHELHVSQRPDHYSRLENTQAVLKWLQDWSATSALVTLVCGPPDALTGYLIYKVERRDASVLKPAIHRAVLEHICVDQAHRRTGLGRALIRAMRNNLRDEGVAKISVTYATFNKASAALIAREGFIPAYVQAEMSVPSGYAGGAPI